jgi:preprotein translocase subunit YajC
MDQNTLTIIMFAVLAIFIFLTWRSGRKRKADAEAAKSQFVPGAEIMTNYGLYGTIKSIDGDVVNLEVAPKTVLKMHRGAILKLVTADDTDAPKSVEEAMARANAEAEAREAELKAGLNTDSATPLAEPEFGERDAAVEKKPARRTTAKKTAE